MNNLLPIIDNLRKRNSLYKSMVYLFCKKDEETLTHLTICPVTQRNWKALEEMIIKKLLKYINKRFNRSNQNVTYQVLNQAIFKYNDLALSLLKQRNWTELTKGLLSHTIISKLRRLALHLISSLTQKLWKTFFTTF
jgi:hypothetical protein